MTRGVQFARIVAALLALGFEATALRADDDGDHELARKLVSEGRVRPLNEVMEKLRAEVPGEMLEVEFEAEKGVLRYEFKILTPNGKVEEVEVDATNGRVLKIEDED